MIVKKQDIILIIFFIVFAIALIFIFYASAGGNGDEAVILVDGEVYQIVSLKNNEMQMIEILSENGNNVVRIENGIVKMDSSDCPDKLCVKQSAISHNHQTIVCLPNKVVIEIRSHEESELDGVAQ